MSRALKVKIRSSPKIKPIGEMKRLAESKGMFASFHTKFRHELSNVDVDFALFFTAD